MGVIYRARQISLHRPVALKMILSSHLATRAAVHRFQTEAEAAARLEYPNIVPIYEIGEHRGQHYYAMKLLSGGNLATRLGEFVLGKGRNLAGSTARERQEVIASLLIRVARAVHHAHQHGILHRDLKPTNILLDEDNEPYVADFGLAKVANDQSGITLTQAALGTPSYMAPEQAAGHTKQATTPSDIYSLGAILYELITGRPPFLGETPLETMRQSLEEDPIRPRVLAPAVDRDLETICLRCLEKRPEKRYATALDLARDLERWKDGESIEARPVTTLEAWVRWCKRRPVVTSLAGALALTLVGGFVGVIGQWRRAERHAAAERVQHAQSLQTLAEMRIDRAQQLLRGNDSAGALALLARVLREDPNNGLAGSRLVHALTQRSFPLPVFGALRHESALTWADYSPDGGRIVTASTDSKARLWDAKTGKLISTLEKHNGQVLTVGFSRDGKFAVSTSMDGTAWVWESATGKPIVRLSHEANVMFADFSPDAQRVVTASADETAQVWRIPSGERATPPLRHKNWVYSARFSRDGNLIVSASGDKTAKIWNAQTGERQGSVLQHTATVWYAEFSPNSERVVTASADGTAQLWNAASGDPWLDPMRHSDEVLWAEFNPDGQRVVTASFDGSARIWDTLTGRALSSPLKHRQRVFKAEFSPDGLRVITASEDKEARLWDAETGKPLSEPLRHDGAVSFARFSPDGQRVLTASEDATACVWDVRLSQGLPMIIRQPAGVQAIDLSPDGKKILTVGLDLAVRVWDAQTGEMLAGPLQHESKINSACFDPGGKRLLTASNDRKARVWDLDSKGGTAMLLGHPQPVSFSCFDSQGIRVATACFDGKVRVWNLSDSSTNVLPQVDVPLALEFSPDGTQLAVASEGPAASVWDFATGQHRLLLHKQRVNSIRFSPDGGWVATASADRKAAIWSVRSTKSPGIFLQHDAEVVFVEFSPDGKKLVTVAADRSARVWDVESGGLVQGPLRHDSKVNVARFSPDGEALLTASDDATALLWDLRSGQTLSEPFAHEHAVNSAGFSKAGHSLLTGSLDRSLRIWPLIPVSTPVPGWVPELAEALALRRINNDGLSESVRVDDLVRLRRIVGNGTGRGLYRDWGKWFFGDSASRPASPGSTLTTTDYLQRESRVDDAIALRTCLAVAPLNGVAEGRYGRMLLVETNPVSPETLAKAGFHVERALRSAPDDPDVKWSQAALLEAKGQRGDAIRVMRSASEGQHDPAFWNSLGLWLHADGQLSEAESAFTTALSFLAAPREAADEDRRVQALLNRSSVRASLGRSEEAKSDFLLAHGIDARPPDTPGNLVDLTDFYNAGLKEDWHLPTDRGNNLSNLPRGRQIFHGTEFDVRGIVQLASTRLQHHGRRFPERVAGIPVRTAPKRIHFLQGVGWGIPRGEPRTQIGSFIFHYSDGERREMPVYYGDHVRDWHAGSDKTPDTPQASVAWMGENGAPEPAQIRLYKCTWVNPRPEVQLQSIDYETTMTDCALFLIAATVEP
jgi:WD40 repeat protein/Tfp pilus assembly protein PilF